MIIHNSKFMAKAKYLSLLALSALLVGCGPTTSAPTSTPTSDPTSDVPTTAPTSDPTSDPTVPPFVGPSSVGLIGSMADSNWATDIPLTGDSEGKVWTLSDYPFSAGDEWKLRADGAWDWQWSYENLDESSAALFENAGGYGNVKVLTSAYYSISVNAETDVVTVVKGEEITPEDPEDPVDPDVPEGPSWPGDDFQALVYEVSGSEVVVPAYEGATEYELVPDYATYFGIAAIFCYTDDADAETSYYNTLIDAGGYAEVSDEGIAACDPNLELVLSAAYDPEYGSLDIYVMGYVELATEWPTEEFQALVYEATGSEVIVPAYTYGYGYELSEDYLDYGEAIIYCYTEEYDESVATYEAILEEAGWTLFVDEEWYGTCAYDPSGEIAVSYAYSEDYGSLDLCVFAYAPTGDEGGADEGGDETVHTPESILWDFIESLGLNGEVTVDGEDVFFAYIISNFSTLESLCSTAAAYAPEYLVAVDEPTSATLTSGDECYYATFVTSDYSIAVEILTYWYGEGKPVLQVSAYYL